MAQYYIQEETLRELGDAIREKTGTSEQMTPGQMANAILNLPTVNVDVNFLNLSDSISASIGNDGYLYIPLHEAPSYNKIYGIVGEIDWGASDGGLFIIHQSDGTAFGTHISDSSLLEVGFTTIIMGEDSNGLTYLIDPNVHYPGHSVTVHLLYS